MITVLTGENSFEVDQALRQLIAGFDGVAEKVDASTLEVKQLPDLLMGGTLFAAKRLVILKYLSDNKSVWTLFSDWIPRVSDDIQLVLVEPKLDKRTKTYKDLKKSADLRDFPAWTERDSLKAEQWVAGEASRLALKLDRNLGRLLVTRVGPDQWALYHALQKLAVLVVIDAEVIVEVIEASPTENVFGLFDAALKGQSQQVSGMIATLALTEDPYKLLGLLSGQGFQLAALSVADKTSAEVAKDVGAHPFVLSKLAPYAKRLGVSDARQIVTAFAEADSGMKLSVADPWLLIERALLKVAAR